MAYVEELDVGERVKVTDLRTGKIQEGTLLRIEPDATGSRASKAIVEYDNGGVGFVTPIEEGHGG